MREKGILFKAEMVRAILEGRKTQTRRIVKPGRGQDWLTADTLGQVVQMADRGDGWWAMSVDDRPPGPHGTCPGHIGSVRAPYLVGTRLWVRETMKWTREGAYAGHELTMRYVADSTELDCNVVIPPDYCPPRNNSHTDHWGRGDDHLPESARWGFTTTYGVCPSMFMPRWASRIDLEVTEVRCQRLQDITEEDAKAEGAYAAPSEVTGNHPLARVCFERLWDSINGEGSWESNPWVFAYTFRRLA